MKTHTRIPYHLHVSRVLLASLCLVAIGILHVPSDKLFPVAKSVKNVPSVLAYATNINRSDLVSYTNSARAANGLGNLAENAKLNVAAQLKANDMIANNYWAHVSPTGVQPWYWFSQAGYDYVSAGENLAYGFSTSDAVVTAWMNSAGHRANILGSFQDVGHGIANGENYQGAQNTVVVAHYGTARAAAPVAPQPAAPTTPTQTPTAPVATPRSTALASPTAPTTSGTPTPVPTATPEPVASQNQKATNEKATSPQTTAVPVNTPHQSTASTTSPTEGVPTWQLLLTGQAPLLVLISLSILTIVGAGYIATHVSLVRHATQMGEQYIMHHPVIDASFVVVATVIVLLTTIGRIG